MTAAFALAMQSETELGTPIVGVTKALLCRQCRRRKTPDGQIEWLVWLEKKD